MAIALSVKKGHFLEQDNIEQPKVTHISPVFHIVIGMDIGNTL
jgi:hypothetical protein